MAKYPYNCYELDPEAWPYECRDFTPSVRRGMSDAEYAAFMAECADLAEDAEAFKARGCKRRAHRMMAGGRQQWRGKGAPGAEQRGEYYSALQQQDPTLTPKLRRTQRSLRQAGNKAASIEQALTDMLFRRGQEGLPTMAFSPGRVPPDFEQLIRQYAIPRRATAFREIYLRYGLNFFPERLPELPLRVRILAFTQGLAALGITPRPSGREVRFQGGSRQQNLSAVIVNGKSDSQIVQRLNDALDDLRPSREPQARTLSAFTVLMLTLQSLREGDTPPKVEGFVFGSQSVMLPRRAVPRLSEMQGITALSAPELQHLIYGVEVSVRLKPDIEKLRYITPADLARWLTGDTLKRKKRRGRTLARENPMKPKFINVANYQDLAPGSARELPDYPGYCVYRKATKNSESLPLEDQLVITTCKRAMSWMNIAQAYKSEPLTASENPMPRPKRKRIAPIARRRKVAKPAPIARRRKAAPKLRRVTGQFDPLAELIKEFAPAPKRPAAAAPIAARPAKKIAHLANDPYATTVFHHGAGAIVPVNRRNPRRKKARTNPDAAAAMKLHHETGMSLKEAWQCVQDGGNYDFGSQYEYRKGPYTAGDAMPPVNRRNPKRKKTRTKSPKSDAAAAMALHHKQGIPLKRAWAIVKGRNR